MKSNLFWQVYKNLEREFLSIAEVIHIDDKQLDVYSMRIADLLVRTVVEIESISKQLYVDNRGTEIDSKKMYFDTVCLEHLNNRWLLEKKVVNVVSPSLYLEKEENIVLTPLVNAQYRSPRSSLWNQAYQAVKHDRANSLSEWGRIKYLLQGLAALYVLNLYYKDVKYIKLTGSDKHNIDRSFGSSIFSVKVHVVRSLSSKGEYGKSSDYDECVYIEDHETDSKKRALEALADEIAYYNKQYGVEFSRLVGEMISKGETPTQEWVNQMKIPIMQKVRQHPDPKINRRVFDSLKNLLYDVVLNKQQY